MRFKQVGNKSDLVGVVIAKNNDTVQINARTTSYPFFGWCNGTMLSFPLLPNTAGSVRQCGMVYA